MGFLRLLAWSCMTVVMVVMLLAGAGYWVYNEAEAPGPLAEQQTVFVPPHSGIAGVAELLGERGVLIQPITTYPGTRTTTAGEAWRQLRNWWIIPVGGLIVDDQRLDLAQEPADLRAPVRGRGRHVVAAPGPERVA